MNTVAMITLVGSTIVGTAQFNTWDECVVARERSVAQDNVTAKCAYHQPKVKDRSGEKIFSSMLQAMTAMAATTCGTVDNKLKLPPMDLEVK